MDIINQLYAQFLVQPVYNGLVALYATLGNEQSGLTFILVGLAAAVLFLPALIRNYYDQERTKDLREQMETIKAEETNPEKQQQKILKLLRHKDISFQSESIFLFGLAIILFLLYPILLNHWTQLDLSQLYDFTVRPDSLNPNFLNITLNHSSPTLSLIPTILLFFELRQSYKEQKFLTGFVDRWYPVILPLFVYFLIFWLPSGLSLVLATALATGLYVRTLLWMSTTLQRRKRTKSAT